MKKIEKKIDSIFKTIQTMNGQSSDIKTRKIEQNENHIGIVFLESVSSDDKISDFLIRSIMTLTKDKKITSKELFTILYNHLFNSTIKEVTNYEDLFFHLASGFTAVFVEDEEKAIVVETRSTLDRGVQESTTDVSILGPKDSFTENPVVNLGLIRKRIKDPNLYFEEMNIGRRTKSKVTLAYMQDIAEEKRIQMLKERLNEIDIDGILDSGNLKSFLNQQPSSFPKILSTERPDLVCGQLLEGKIAILVENTPFVLIFPTVFTDFLHSPGDYYQKAFNINFSRLLRVFGFLITLLIPAAYVAIMTYNPEMVPDRLFISIAIQREGVPFPTAFEILMLGITFELLRECDLRMPSKMGNAISVVGGLVLGEAAVNAGIVSPFAVIIVAITSIAGLLFSDIDMINALRWWRLVFIFFAAVSGMIGVVIASILLITHLASLETLGVPYLTPIAPFLLEEQKDAILLEKNKNLKKRPSYLTKKNRRRLKFKEGQHEKKA